VNRTGEDDDRPRGRGRAGPLSGGGGMRLTRWRSALLMTALVLAAASPVHQPSARAALVEKRWMPTRVTPPTPPPMGVCTMADSAARATVEVQLAYAVDFCELLSKALAGDVFHAALVVTPDRLWHFAHAALSCRMRFRSERAWITIWNSLPACRWLKRTATGWHSATRQFGQRTNIRRPRPVRTG
jgi:hypothetical protein